MFGFAELPEWLQSDDKVFKFDNDCHNNACVTHCHRQLYDVAYGYEYTAKRLAEQAMAREVLVDGVIEPLLFMYRHWLELIIKHAIVRILLLEDAPRPISVNGHKLLGLWDRMAIACKPYFSEDEAKMLSRFRRVVAEFDELDPGGTAFRYPYNLEFRNELSEIQHINVRHLYLVMRDMSAVFSAIDYVIDQQLEYQADCRAEYVGS